MPIGTPVERYAAETLFNGQNQSISPASTITTGTEALLFNSCDEVVSSVADSVGNSWSVVHTYSPASRHFVSVAVARVATQIGTGDTITITYATSGNQFRHTHIQEVSGLKTSGLFDASADNQESVSATFTVGPTGTLQSSNEIGFSFLSDTAGNHNVSTMAGWTATTTANLGGSGIGTHLYYQIVSSTSPLTSTGNWDLASTYSGTVVTFMGLDVFNLAPVIYGRGAC